MQIGTKSLFFFILIQLLACQSRPAQESTEFDPVLAKATISTATFYDVRGEDCDQPDSLQMNCASIDFEFPQVKTKKAEVDTKISRDVRAYLAAILSGGAPLQDSTALEEAAQLFWSYREEMEGSAMYNSFVAESSYEVLLDQPDYLTIEVNSYTYQGGAHGSPSALVQSYELESGKALGLEDIFTDLAALKTIAEAQFRQERQDAFEQGFEFDDLFAFALPANFGLTKAGLYCHYLAYEVGPYALGNTIFTIPFSELEGILRPPFDTW
jgi:hypothetical protein